MVEGEGPDHSRTFTAVLTIGSVPYGTGSGSSKKDAEREAARLTADQISSADGDADILTLVLGRG